MTKSELEKATTPEAAEKLIDLFEPGWALLGNAKSLGDSQHYEAAHIALNNALDRLSEFKEMLSAVSRKAPEPEAQVVVEKPIADVDLQPPTV